MAAPKQILVIDDEKDLAETVAELVGSFDGRKVFNANSPSEAYMRSIVQRFDLIIADFKMPKTNGLDLVKVIRGQKLNSTVPVIMISGYPEEFADRIKDLADIRIMAKPFELENLLKVTDEMLALKSLREAKKPQFDLEVLNEFLSAVAFTFNHYTGVQTVKSKKPFLLSREQTITVDLSILVRLQTEKFKGTLAMSFPESTMLRLINGLTRERHTEISPENRQYIDTITKTIMEQATKGLANHGINVSDLKPELFPGAIEGLSELSGRITIVIPVQALIGEFFIVASAAPSGAGLSLVTTK